MALIQLPREYHPELGIPNRKPTSAVTINRKNPFGAHLKFCVLPTEATGFRDICNDVAPSTGGDPVIEPVGGVLNSRYDAVGDYHDYESGELVNTGKPFTIVWRGKTSTDSDMLASLLSDATGVAFPIFHLDGGGYVDLQWGNAVTTSWKVSRIDTSLEIRNLHTWFITYNAVDHTDSNSFSAWMDRISQTVLAGASLSATTNGTTLGDRRNHDVPATQDYEYFNVFDIEFNQGMVDAYMDDQYQFLDPVSPMMYFTAEAAAGFQAAWARRQSQIIGAGVR